MNFQQFVHEFFSSDPLSHNFVSWCATGLAMLVSLDTVIRLWTERHRLLKEDLNDEDRAFAWRLVVFTVLPLLTWIDWRATDVAAQLSGGYLSAVSYGFIWYQALIEGLSHATTPEQAALVYVAGEAAQIAFALLLVPALFLRPHPFFASFLGYTIAFTLGFNLIVDPILSLAGFGLPRWAEIVRIGMTHPGSIDTLVACQAGMTGLYLFFISSSAVRLWFSDLTRPEIAEHLKNCLKDSKVHLLKSSLADADQPPSSTVTLKLGILYLRAGLNRQAGKLLKEMGKLFPGSLSTTFLAAMLAFQDRNYKEARLAFVKSADFAHVDGELKASLLAAAACSAFAQGDTEGALDLCQRALEFEDACLTARLVKVDAYLAKGKKEQAAQEIMVAMHLGLDFDLKDKVPVDADQVFDLICKVEEKTENTALMGQIEQLEATLEKSGRPNKLS
ncbi:MAG: hypothetical protein KGS72_06675 [Cyanobacteria bacterium REEB67]|nr:hypothetical protein [Cyanobacteria bacterium REEB67]